MGTAGCTVSCAARCRGVCSPRADLLLDPRFSGVSLGALFRQRVGSSIQSFAFLLSFACVSPRECGSLPAVQTAEHTREGFLKRRTRITLSYPHLLPCKPTWAFLLGLQERLPSNAGVFLATSPPLAADPAVRNVFCACARQPKTARGKRCGNGRLRSYFSSFPCRRGTRAKS